MNEFQKLDDYSTPNGFRGKSKVYVQFWWIAQSLLFKPSPQLFYGWRRFILRCFGAKVGKGVLIRSSVSIVYPWKVKIGDYSWIGDDVVLYSLGKINIGKHAVISQRSYLCTGSHDYLKRDFAIFAKPIHIKDECWLATDVYVAPNVTIGKGTVVGARSSVFKDLPKGKVCLGSPAKVIKNRSTATS